MAKKGGGLGAWAFLIGIILAVILGVFQTQLGSVTWISILLVLLGLIVGLLNLSGSEANTFLLAAVSLVIVSNLGGTALGVIDVVGNILNAIMTLVVPATVIVALKAVFSAARN